MWFYLGWRSSEIVALRFGWVDSERLCLKLHRGRIPRMGRLEAEPKTGRREVDCSYAPEIFRAPKRLRARPTSRGPERILYSPMNAAGHSIRNGSTMRFGNPPKAGIAERGQYCIRDTFISLALSSGEDPGWVAQLCGTSEEMIFRHYRKWIPGLQVGAGRRIGTLLQGAFGGSAGRELSPRPSPKRSFRTKIESDQPF